MNRPCKVCGTFYPADQNVLRQGINDLLERVPHTKVEGSIAGIIVPHAGLAYSGATAAFAYSMLRNSSFSRVVIVSPSHKEYFNGISVFSGSSYSTPLGRVEVDQVFRDRILSQSSRIEASDAGHGEEHAIEVQLPFLQTVLNAFTIVPIVMGDQRREYCYELGEALASTVDHKSTLLVASTDL